MMKTELGSWNATKTETSIANPIQLYLIPQHHPFNQSNPILTKSSLRQPSHLISTHHLKPQTPNLPNPKAQALPQHPKLI